MGLTALPYSVHVVRLSCRRFTEVDIRALTRAVDEAVACCRQAGFPKIVFRGDTAFSQSEKLDAWDEQDVTFYFGHKAMANLVEIADNLPRTVWRKLLRPPRYEVRTDPRAKPVNVKARIVRRREFERCRLKGEQYAEFEYQPVGCEQSYRMVVLRKDIAHEKGQRRLFGEIRDFFYITNDWAADAEDVVFEANARCDQENLIAPLAGGVRTLSAPVDNLLSSRA